VRRGGLYDLEAALLSGHVAWCGVLAEPHEVLGADLDHDVTGLLSAHYSSLLPMFSFPAATMALTGTVREHRAGLVPEWNHCPVTGPCSTG